MSSHFLPACPYAAVRPIGTPEDYFRIARRIIRVLRTRPWVEPQLVERYSLATQFRAAVVCLPESFLHS